MIIWTKCSNSWSCNFGYFASGSNFVLAAIGPVIQVDSNVSNQPMDATPVRLAKTTDVDLLKLGCEAALYLRIVACNCILSSNMFE